MADPTVHITNGIPDSGTGNITTLGQTLVDGANATMGVTTGAAVTTDASGTLQSYLRGLVKLFAAAVAGGAGSLFSKVTDGTNTAAVKAASTAPVATDPALVVALSPNGLNTNGQTSMAGSAPMTIASDQTITVKATTTTNGTTKTRIVSAASTNATNVKASAGKVMSLRLFNTAAYDVFFKFYDKASAPTVGTDTPSWTIPIKAGTGYSNNFVLGDDFAIGIAYAITKLQADSDTTVVAANDVTGKIHWI